MRKSVSNVVVVISLLLFAATAAMAAMSHWRFDSVTLNMPYSELSLLNGPEGLHLIHLHLDFTQDNPGDIARPPTLGWHVDHDSGDTDDISDRLILNDPAPFCHPWIPLRIDRGCPSSRFSESPPLADGWQATTPHWLLLLLLALAPIWRMVRIGMARIRPRPRRNLCPKCGYDLRASTERCPECGTAIAVRPRERSV